MSAYRVQWRGDNLHAIEQLLEHHVAELRAEQGTLYVRGFGDLDLEVQLGETLEVVLGQDGLFDSIGIHRLPSAEGPQPEIMWTGDNLRAITKFVEDYDVTLSVIDQDIYVELIHTEEGFVLHRGDKLFKNQLNQLGCQRSGKDHRV